MPVPAHTLLLLLLPALSWCAPPTPAVFTVPPPPAADPEPVTELALTTTDLPEDVGLTTEVYDYDANGTLKTDLIFEKLQAAVDLHKVVFAVTSKVAAVAKKFWRFVVETFWKPLLKLYISPLRLIHTYLLPELISAECFDVYHGDVHRYENPLKPYRPNKLELVKCIFQYLGHYVRSWQFVNRIEGNGYDLV